MSLKEKNIDRVSLWMIGLAAIFVTVGGIMQFKSYLTSYQRVLFGDYQYFAEKAQQQLADEGLLSPTDTSLDALQQTDTDEDTLSDFDELYLYNTSIYLADTDSDGATDRDEITAGTSPTCAQGTECGAAPQEDASTATANAIAEFVVPEGFVPSDDPAVLRKQLVDIGIPQELLDQVDDVSLQEFIATDANAANVTEEQLLESTIATLQQMTMTEKREFLVTSGASAEQVDALNDAQVEQLFVDALGAVIAERQDKTNTAQQENNNADANDDEQ